jgi:alkanesulfonate monooxygenase
VIAPRVADIRRLAALHGRRGEDIQLFSLMTVVLGETDPQAKAKYEEYRTYASHEGALVLMSGWTGIDFSTFDLDQQVRHVTNDAGRTAMDNITRADPDRTWTVRQVAEHVAIGGIGPVLVGTPAQVADSLDAWIEATGVDGFNMAFALAPETFVDIVDLLVPELQRRGRFKRDYGDGTLREKLFGAGARLPQSHPASRHRISPTAAD